jgi:hypothetical protein
MIVEKNFFFFFTKSSIHDEFETLLTVQNPL